MSNKKLQKSGNNSNQYQIENMYVSNEMSEQRVREICLEVAVQVIAQNTTEANELAMQRIERFVDLLLPRIQKIEKDFTSFSDPSFQVLLRKAQLTSACTERDCDYTILTELLAHRINNKSDIKKKASITKAVEIIDQVDDDSLCALTMYHAITLFVPRSGNISDGIQTLSNLYEKINPNILPKNEMWIDNLSILGAVRIVPFSSVSRFERILAEKVDGYVCVGIKKDSEDYLKAIELLKNNGINTGILVDNELLEGYVRLELSSKKSVEDLTFEINIMDNEQKHIQHKVLTKEQKKCLYDIFDLYSKDGHLEDVVNTNFENLLITFEPILKIITWLSGLSVGFQTTSIGRVIAHANAKRIDNTLPDLD